MSLYLALTVASLKMYFRNKQALFWALFFPMLIIGIFGLMNFDQYNPPDVGVSDLAGNDASSALISSLRGPDNDVLGVDTGDAADLHERLNSGGLDAVIEIPEGFGSAEQVSTVRATYDLRKTQEQGVISTVLAQSLERVFRDVADVPEEYLIESRFDIETEAVAGQGQGFKGFLVPGVAAMAIMQAGIFGVVFSLVRFKAQGVLRRLQATPIGPSHFLVGQVTTRLVVTVLQTYVLIAVGIILLGVTIANGDLTAWIDITVLALLGGALFISLGLAISGWAKTEDTAAPIANIVTLPMMFLSGVFFPLNVLPDWVTSVSQFLPLTYLADALRAVTTTGAGLTDLGAEMAGLAVWGAVSFLVATRLFKWE
ncbi:MAG: ABC transporter permease [Dehalococcoidia bacterium]